MVEDDGVDKPLAYSSAVLFRKTVREDLERVSDGSNPVVAGFDRTGYIIDTLSALRAYSAGSVGVMPFTMGFFDMCAGRDREPDEPQGYEDPYKLEDWIKRAEPYFSDLVERYALAVNAMVHEEANKYYN
ncbi:hypothetical protein [Actinomyces sp.]|uniref:hypothetical protein n=1 Tax=Actinomyces sp. TaxID=29317 RepID=UPI002912F25A|nr:hypothetical protein [Actinomyces sp.]MDU7239301.1 hypothetical protein [Actinomyces sp.]